MVSTKFGAKTYSLRVTNFGSGVDLDDVWVDLESQGQGHEVKNVFPSTQPGLTWINVIHADRIEYKQFFNQGLIVESLNFESSHTGD